ncbi:UNVERIFIED_CONTAM: hypothetical protein HDU68_008391 [Siphonaria sp. JEL0065]|nr:hypothetical protein HDU68_008391 [Siphonaria sp. JEL0065]
MLKRNSPSSPRGSNGPAKKAKARGGLSLAELKEKHRQERQKPNSTNTTTSTTNTQVQPQQQKQQQQPSIPLTKSLSAISKPVPKPTKPLIATQTEPEPVAKKPTNPFSNATASKLINSKNPFGILKTIESTGASSVVFPTASRLMQRYNSSPNVLQTAAWTQKVSRKDFSREVEGSGEEEEEEDEDSGAMSDLEPDKEDEALVAFRLASAAEPCFMNRSMAASVTAGNDDSSFIERPPSRNNMGEEPSICKPRLFSILVEKKAPTFEKAVFTSCNNVFQAPRKKATSSEATALSQTQSKPETIAMDSCVNDEAAIDFEFDSVKQTPEVVSFDYSVKTGMTIISTDSQPWFQERDESEKYSTLENYIQKTPVYELPLKSQFDQYLISHVYPNGPKAPTHVGLMTRILAIKPGTVLKPFEQSELNYYRAKEEEWRSSFKSIFASLLLNHTGHFYYMNSEFTVLFQHPTAPENATGDYYAVLTKASPGLRGLLTSKGIPYASVMPPGKVKNTYTASAEVGDANAEEKREAKSELMEMESLQPGRTIAKQDENRSPLQLTFHGLDPLTKLHDYLLYWVEQSIEKRALHQPVLISPSAFLNASIKMADIIKIEQIESTDVQALSKTATSTTTSTTKRCTAATLTTTIAYKLRISGFLLPRSISGIKSLIQNSSGKDAHVRVLMDVDERTLGLNLEEGSAVVDSGGCGGVEIKKVADEKVCGKTVRALEFLGGCWVG